MVEPFTYQDGNTITGNRAPANMMINYFYIVFMEELLQNLHKPVQVLGCRLPYNKNSGPSLAVITSVVMIEDPLLFYLNVDHQASSIILPFTHL